MMFTAIVSCFVAIPVVTSSDAVGVRRVRKQSVAVSVQGGSPGEQIFAPHQKHMLRASVRSKGEMKESNEKHSPPIPTPTITDHLCFRLRDCRMAVGCTRLNGFSTLLDLQTQCSNSATCKFISCRTDGPLGCSRATLSSSCDPSTQKLNRKWAIYEQDTAPAPTSSPTTAPTRSPTTAPIQHLSLQDVMTCPKGSVSKTIFLTSCQYDDIVDRITALMRGFSDQVCTNNTCHVADFAGCVLRAAGHDLMDFRNNGNVGSSGGSDGCLSFEDPDNKGLVNCVRGDFNLDGDTDPDVFSKTLHDVYMGFCDVVSLADFMVIAAEAVMGFTETSKDVNLKSDFQVAFMYGRTTSTSCVNNPALPNPADGCQANEDTFISSSAFSLTWRQTAALMGVHTLGKAHLANSGYSGWWTDETNVASFNNNYFIGILNKGWGPTVIQSSGKSQWIRLGTQHDNPGRNHPEMMLNTDMCLVYKDVLAESSNCCAWDRFAILRDLNITDTHQGKPIFCGFSDPFVNFALERDWCCGANGPERDCAGTGPTLTPQGPAKDAVRQFAADQDVWLGEFKSVWKLVTEKGAGSLKSLEICFPPIVR